MKRIARTLSLALALLLALGAFGALAEANVGVKITAQAFPDARFRAYVKATFDVDGNGVLSAKELQSAVAIRIDRGAYRVRSLKGIERFTALRYLTLIGADGDSYLAVKGLDLSGNRKLERLTLEKVRLGKLDLVRNTRLRELWINDCDIAALDLAKNRRLEKVDIGNCARLRALDLTGNRRLTYLRLHSNGLLRVKLDHLPQLYQLLLVGHASATLDLDLTGCTKILSTVAGTASREGDLHLWTDGQRWVTLDVGVRLYNRGKLIPISAQ